MNPPGFVWRPQRGAATYEFQASRDVAFGAAQYQATGLRYHCHCLPRTLDAGTWHWRVRFVDTKGALSAWSRTRSFTVAQNARPFPMPDRKTLLGRIPKSHPRLFVRPEQLPELRRLAAG